MHEGNFLVGDKLASHFQTFIQFVCCPELQNYYYLVELYVHKNYWPDMKKTKRKGQHLNSNPQFLFSSTVRGENARQTFAKELKKFFFLSLC